MSFLPEVSNGVLILPKKRIRIKSGKPFRKSGKNPRKIGTNPRKKAKDMWREYYKGISFIGKL